VLSDGITANAVDVTTGKTFTATYGTLSTTARVVRASSPAPAPTAPHGGAPAPAPAAPAAAPTTAPSTSPSTGQTTTGSLPTTGGGATHDRRLTGDIPPPP
jgi:hypothetical protein